MMISASGGLRAGVADRLVLRGRQVGQPDCYAEIIDVLGEQGRPQVVLLADGRTVRYSPEASSTSGVAVERLRRDSRA